MGVDIMGKSGMTLKASAEVVRGPRGLSIKELKYKETLANGNNIYEVILENNVVIGEIESKKGDKGIQGIKGDTGRGIFSLLKKGKQGPETTYEFTYTDGTTDIFIVEDGENAYEIATDNGFEGTEEEWLLSLIGPQGKSLEFNWNGTELGIRVEGETAYNYVNLKGEKGETGPRGIQGPKGEKGDKGDVGPAGAQGIQGVAGPKGDKGDIGATGPKGDKGPAGPQGIQGLQGVAGPKGEKGDKGEQGIQGPKGEKGDIGPKGDTTAITYGTTAGTVMEGSKLAEILGIPYGGSLNTTTSKVVGTAYYDNTTKKTYKCTVANSLNYADSTKFEAISNNDLLAKLQNLNIIPTKLWRGSIANTTLQISALKNYSVIFCNVNLHGLNSYVFIKNVTGGGDDDADNAKGSGFTLNFTDSSLTIKTVRNNYSTPTLTGIWGIM